MPSIHFRGKTYTNDKLKGPFTEAKDDFKLAFSILRQNINKSKEEDIGDYAACEAYACDDHVMFFVGDTWVMLTPEGKVEVGEGG